MGFSRVCVEQGVGGQRPPRRDTKRRKGGNGGGDDRVFFLAKDAIFAAMGVEGGHGNARVGNGKVLTESCRHDLATGDDARCRQAGGNGAERFVNGHRRHPQSLGDQQHGGF